MTRASVVIAALLAGCIIPDAGIVVRGDFVNEGAVRIVNAIPITDDANEACASIDDGPRECPGVPAGLPGGLVAGQFCSCPEGERDSRAALRFDVFVEDPDVDAEGDPADDILGVFLLDPESGAFDPDWVSYLNYLAPDQPAELFTAGEFPPIERPDPNLRSWTIGVDEVDLCNNNDGQRVDPGLHELRIVVTDRPWHQELELDGSGAIVLDEEDEPMRGEPIFGVPDLGAGASYDSRSFVFRCFDGSDVSNPPPGGECGCVPEVEP